MTLFFLRPSLTDALLGVLFDLHERNAYRNVEMMKEFLSEPIPLTERVRERKLRSMAEGLEEMSGIAWVIDATEQERQKPKEAEARRGYDAGRKKRHRIKRPIVVEKGKGWILEVFREVFRGMDGQPPRREDLGRVRGGRNVCGFSGEGMDRPGGFRDRGGSEGVGDRAAEEEAQREGVNGSGEGAKSGDEPGAGAGRAQDIGDEEGSVFWREIPWTGKG